ncbi:MAG: tetratricopeptide repeat protein [Alphaproteobacteria bacterium]
MPHAQVDLGYSYETGTGVARDPVKAVAWYRRAAEQDFPQAQYYLGAAYERGSDVDKNLRIAAAWYQRADDQGVVLAGKRLDVLKEHGVEPAVIESETREAEVPPAEPEPEPEMRETNLIESAPPPEPEPAPLSAAVKAAGAETAPATAPGRRAREIAERQFPYAARFLPQAGEYGKRLAHPVAKKHDDLLGAFNYAVAEVDLGADKGIYHRLEAGPAGSLNEAAAICVEIKARGDSCVVVRP